MTVSDANLLLEDTYNRVKSQKRYHGWKTVQTLMNISYGIYQRESEREFEGKNRSYQVTDGLKQHWFGKPLRVSCFSIKSKWRAWTFIKQGGETYPAFFLNRCSLINLNKMAARGSVQQSLLLGQQCPSMM